MASSRKRLDVEQTIGLDGEAASKLFQHEEGGVRRSYIGPNRFANAFDDPTDEPADQDLRFFDNAEPDSDYRSI